MAKVSLPELRDLIGKAIIRKQDSIIGMSGDNPQMKLTREYARGQKDALSDIKSALYGDDVYLKMLAGK